MKVGHIIAILVAAFIVGIIAGIYLSRLLFPYFAADATMITVKDVAEYKVGIPMGTGFLFHSIRSSKMFY